ncbi:thioesterase family protein [Candidatus Mycobacterium wuenschmannii]|uniref:Thioesterase family protein n=1 Tax=Candidatus Mycobacterium wuenschmannii TaxID=3027808 RepID=A0ABY8W161_9MYCO|nr:acyl-CoA thioesterase domain-containing protein [Candidatus Mycobacterium wuenschmannii]WIM89096.1 thioesterase family protein [Candidatus Mycobacterium wuenschmannii]
MNPAHFTRSENGEFEPTQFAGSHWGDDHLNGPAVVGLAAQALERDCGSPDFMASRLTVDLFRAARGLPTAVSVRVIRDGRRVRSAECDIAQDGRLIARASLLQYRRSTAPPGELWSVPMVFPFPPPLEDGAMTAVHSDAVEWSRSPGEHQNASRKRFYNSAIDIVAGQPNSPFVRAVMAAESTSLVTNLGTEGIGYINGDLTVGLARLPIGEWIGVQADSHWAEDGVAVGTATLFDRSGAFGSGMTTAVANPAAQIDFANSPFPLRIP